MNDENCNHNHWSREKNTDQRMTALQQVKMLQNARNGKGSALSKEGNGTSISQHSLQEVCEIHIYL
jgi:hypothetical protein